MDSAATPRPARFAAARRPAAVASSSAARANGATTSEDAPTAAHAHSTFATARGEYAPGDAFDAARANEDTKSRDADAISDE